MLDPSSLRSLMLSQTAAVRMELINSLTTEEKQLLFYDWRFWARSEQLQPSVDYLVWLIEAGRGWGKTRTGAETIKQWALDEPGGRFALVAETFGDGRDVMVEGESGMLSVLPPSLLRGYSASSAWNRSMGELYLANGSRFDIYSAEKPEQLRGPQHHGAWADEVAKWPDAKLGVVDETTWSNLMLGLRLGRRPRCVVTTTPKPVKLLRGDRHRPGIRTQAGTVRTKGTTYDNLENLAPAFKQRILQLYEGTRLGRQELLAEDLEDVDGALWTHALIESARIKSAPVLLRVVVGVDPAVSSKEGSDETGIVAAGAAYCSCLGKPELHGFVLEDLSDRYTPDGWARKVIGAYRRLSADRIVAEVNNGGDLVKANIATVDRNAAYKSVHASKGKVARAEPIAALYEQGKVHHVGSHDLLEDQMSTWIPGMDSPDRMDALVWALTELLLGEVADGAMSFGSVEEENRSTWVL